MASNMAKTFIPYKGKRIIPGCVDLVVHWECFNNKCENKFQFQFTGTRPSVAELSQLCADFGSQFQVAISTEITQNVRFIDVDALDVSFDGANVGHWDFPPNTTGANTGTDIPLNVAANISLLTGRGGRRYRGRKSISGFAETHVDHNTLGSEIMNMLLTLAVQLVKAWVSGKFHNAVGSLPKVIAAGPPQVIGSPATCTVLTGVNRVDDNVDSQKTRLNGRGR